MLKVASLLLPLALTTGGEEPKMPPSYAELRAYVTGYNTVPGQTDSEPCIAASGANICGRRDAVACPRKIGLGTVVEIRGNTYVCEDRLAKKYNQRFDISCDKDKSCPTQVTGWVEVRVYSKQSSQKPPAAAERHREGREPAIPVRSAEQRVAGANSKS